MPRIGAYTFSCTLLKIMVVKSMYDYPMYILFGFMLIILPYYAITGKYPFKTAALVVVLVITTIIFIYVLAGWGA